MVSFSFDSERWVLVFEGSFGRFSFGEFSYRNETFYDCTILCFSPRVMSRRSAKKKSVLRKGFLLSVFLLESAHLYLFHSFETCADVLASLGVLLLFVSGPSVPFPSIPRIS